MTDEQFIEAVLNEDRTDIKAWLISVLERHDERWREGMDLWDKMVIDD